VNSAEIEAASEYLLKARRACKKIANLPFDLRPQSLEDGYAIQHSLLSKLATAYAGWFVALTSAEMQHVHRAQGPIYGRILNLNIQTSPGVVVLNNVMQPVTVEAEYGFRIGRELAPRTASYTEAEVADAIEAVIPMLEFVDSNFENLMTVDVASLVADNAAEGHIVLGGDIKASSPAELLDDPALLMINGRCAAEGHPSKSMGSPIRVLTWFVNELIKRGSGICTGEIVGTGNCLDRYCFGTASDVVIADFGRLGSVSAALNARRPVQKSRP